jgi:hypothetical protein
MWKLCQGRKWVGTTLPARTLLWGDHALPDARLEAFFLCWERPGNTVPIVLRCVARMPQCC